jgi:hypothetical protein
VIVHQLTAIGAVDLRHMERDFAPANVCGPRGSCCATAGSTGRAPRSCPASPPWSLTTAAFGESGGEARQNPDRVALWGILWAARTSSRSRPTTHDRRRGRPDSLQRLPSTGRGSLDRCRPSPLRGHRLGGNVTTVWKNEVAPRRLLQMMRYRPALDAARLQAPCSCALRSRTGRRRSTAPGRSPRPPVAARYGSTRDALRLLHRSCHPDRALADQLDFLYQHLQASPKVA